MSVQEDDESESENNFHSDQNSELTISSASYVPLDLPNSNCGNPFDGVTFLTLNGVPLLEDELKDEAEKNAKILLDRQKVKLSILFHAYPLSLPQFFMKWP